MRGLNDDKDISADVSALVTQVETGGDDALRSLRERFDGISQEVPVLYDREALEHARDELSAEERALLERTTERVRAFAAAQRDCLHNLDTSVEGGRAGHDFAPVDAAGCYAPGGRYPLVSSVLMTATTARAAGVGHVCVATPSQAPIMRAAAAIAGADCLLAAGGAHAIAALAFGTKKVAPCDVICGPGNVWVTEAKRQVAGRVGIDMLAGPSELVVVGDETADPAVVAADLLAQAEHDPDARVVLLTTHAPLVEKVRAAAAAQLEQLGTREVALQSWEHARLEVHESEEALIHTCNRMAPEHLHLNVGAKRLAKLREGIRHYGALFVGAISAEVLGDYGAGPNHVLPTGGTARFRGGLSVLTFLRMRTWLAMSEADAVSRDAEALAKTEGLDAHAASAALRLRTPVKLKA